MTELKNYKGALVLNWINKEKSIFYEINEEKCTGIKPIWVEKNDIRVSEPRILRLIKTYGDLKNENMLIKGDNLLALRTLVKIFKNRTENDRVKCIYIDPPYNTGSAFEKYDDHLEHSQWLTMMRDRLILLKKLLRKDGIIFVQIGDDEMAYLKVLMDEIFGRSNCIGQVVVRMSHSAGMKRKAADKRIIKNVEYILVYGMSDLLEINPVYEECKKYPVNYYQFIEINGNSNRAIIQKLVEIPFVREKLNYYNLKSNNPSIHTLYLLDDEFYNWVLDHHKYIARKDSNIPKLTDIDLDLIKKNEVIKYKSDLRTYWIGKGRTGRPFQLYTLKDKVKEITIEEGENIKSKSVLTDLLGDWWDDFYRDMSRVDIEGGVLFKNGKKPERLIQRILEISTKEGDIVLDSFLGSGTTAAVAHKMARRWIGVEIGKHTETLCIKRLERVISGDDLTGISKAVIWKGGGGFNYYNIGESVISNRDLNWDLSYEEIAQAIFLILDFSLLDKIEDGIFLGNRNDKLAFVIISQDLDIISEEKLLNLMDILNNKYFEFSELDIYTNNGIGLKLENLPTNIDIKKIPEYMLNKFKFGV